MWRPENWETTKPETTEALGGVGRGAFPDDIFNAGVEAGADAILEALLNDRNIITVWRDTITMPGFMTDLDKHIRSLGNGRWVFIPEEK